MLFLVSEHSVASGCYTLSELEFARKKWPSPSGYVLPVLLPNATVQMAPAYLRSVQFVKPIGNVVAETCSAVVAMSQARTVRRVLDGARIVALAAGLFVSAAMLWPNISSALQPMSEKIGLRSHLREVENAISLSYYQFLEARYLDDAEKLAQEYQKSSRFSDKDKLRIDELIRLTRDALTATSSPKDLSPGVARFGRLYGDDPWLPILVAAAHFRQQKYEECSESLGGFKSTTEYPAQATARFFEGVCILRSARELAPDLQETRYRDAIAAFVEAGKLSDDIVDSNHRQIAKSSASYFVGIGYFYLKDIQNASKQFELTVGFAKGDIRARALNGLGFTNFILGELETAEAAFLMALEEFPKFPYARTNYGYVLLAKDRYDAAIEIFERNLNDKDLVARSPRDVTLAKLAIGHALELRDKDRFDSNSYYSNVLTEMDFNDFAEISSEKLRYAFISYEMADKIYLDRNYYGLEVFAVAFFAKSYIAACNYMEESPESLVAIGLKERSEAGFRKAALSVSSNWFEGGAQGELFLDVNKIQSTLEMVHAE